MDSKITDQQLNDGIRGALLSAVALIDHISKHSTKSGWTEATGATLHGLAHALEQLQSIGDKMGALREPEQHTISRGTSSRRV